jgi:sugar lactone lactonase YvrE
MLGANRQKGWSLASVSHVRSLSLALNDADPIGIFFRDDGYSMYATDLNSRVSEYSLTSPWNISTASYLRNFIAVQATQPLGMFMRPDGTEMYLVSVFHGRIAQYSLSTPWNISTASHTRNLSVSATDAGAQSVFFVASGDIMYLLGSGNDKVYRFNLSTPWDISTASFVNDFSVFDEDIVSGGLFFSPDGLRFFVVGSSGDEVNEYSMSTAWDISGASYVRVVSISAQDTSPRNMFIGNDGMAMYVIGQVGREVNEYSLG